MRKQEIFILAVTGLIWLITLRGKPFVGLLYYQFYTGLYLMKVFSQYQWLRIPFVTASLVFFSFFFNKSKKMYFSPQTWLIIALFVVMCISRLTNGLEILGHKYMEHYYKMIFAYILIINLINSKERLRMFLWVLIISGAALAFVTRYHDNPTPYFWMDKNGYASVLTSVIIFPITFALLEKKIILKAESICYFLMILYSIIGTNSRGAYLALAVILFLAIMSNFTVKRLLLLILLLGIVFMRVSDTHWERFGSIRADSEQGGTGGQRIGAWLTAIEVMKDKPILGIGTGEFTDNYLRYATWEAREKVGVRHTRINTHNTFFQIGAENGFVGLFLFLLIIFISFKDVIKALKLCRGDPDLADLKPIIMAIGITLTGYLTAGLFLNYAYRIQLYTLFALSVVIRVITEETKTTDSIKEKEEQLTMVTHSYKHQLALRSLLFIVSTYICLRL